MLDCVISENIQTQPMEGYLLEIHVPRDRRVSTQNYTKTRISSSRDGKIPNKKLWNILWPMGIKCSDFHINYQLIVLFLLWKRNKKELKNISVPTTCCSSLPDSSSAFWSTEYPSGTVAFLRPNETTFDTFCKISLTFNTIHRSKALVFETPHRAIRYRYARIVIKLLQNMHFWPTIWGQHESW